MDTKNKKLQLVTINKVHKNKTSLLLRLKHNVQQVPYEKLKTECAQIKKPKNTTKIKHTNNKMENHRKHSRCSSKSPLSFDEYTDDECEALATTSKMMWINKEDFNKIMEELAYLREKIAEATPVQTPKKPKTTTTTALNQSNPLHTTAVIQTLSGNRFASLAEQEEETNEENLEETNNLHETNANEDKDFPALGAKMGKPSKKAKGRKQKQAGPRKPTETMEVDNANDDSPKKNQKIPAITIYNTPAKELTELNIINKNITHINVYTIKDFTNVETLLVASKKNFFSYTPTQLKPYNILIKKLPHESFTEAEVKSALEEAVSDLHIMAIKPFKHSFWLVQLTKTPNLKTIFHIKTLLNCKVIIEPLKIKNRIHPCHNCQRFGHVASNCKMPFRCIKCTKTHNSGDCNIIKDDVKSQVECVNCKGKHTANAKICPIRISFLERKKNKPTPKFIVNMTKPTSNIREGASLFKASDTQTKINPLPKNITVTNPKLREHLTKKLNPKPSTFTLEGLNKDSSEIFGKDIFECIDTMQSIIKKYPLGQTQNDMEARKIKQALILNFLIQIAQ